jgi:hypothetical protein
MFSRIERTIDKPRPTKSQLDKVTKLGESIGLERKEIIAAIDAPLADSGFIGKSRVSLYVSLIMVTIIVILGVLLTWYVVDPDSFPIPTYTPGTLYATIRPQDFLCGTVMS